MNQNVENYKKKLERKRDNLSASLSDIQRKQSSLEFRKNTLEQQIQSIQHFLLKSDEEIQDHLTHLSRKGLEDWKLLDQVEPSEQ